MVQIIEEFRNPKFSDQLLAGAGRAASEAATEIPKFFGHKLMQAEKAKMQMQENEQIQQLLGQDISRIQDPKMRQMFAENILKGRESQMQQAQKAAPYQGALETIQEMRSIGKKGKLGAGSGVLSSLFGGQRAKDYGKYEQLGKSLISFASTIPIRNKAEFETLAKGLFDPSIRDSEREGILDGMEDLIRRSLAQHGGEMNQNGTEQRQPEKRRSLSEIFG